jgi:hypothetical protein
MTRWRTVAIGSVLVLAALAGLAAVAINFLVDPAHLRQVAHEKARKAWARELQMRDIRFELLPLPAIIVRDLKLVHPTEPPIEAANVTAELEILPLLLGETRYRNVYFKDARIQWEGAPWHVEEAVVESDANLHNVRVAGRLWHNRKPMGVKAQFDDLTRLRVAGAATHGSLELDWDHAHLVATGRIPIDGTLAGHALTVEARGDSPAEICDFFGIARKPYAPFSARFDSRERDGRVDIDKLVATLGRLAVSGSLQYVSGAKPQVDVRLATNRLDWAQTALDLGGPQLEAPALPEMFRDNPLAWPLLVALQGKHGSVEADVGLLILRNGVQLRNLKARGSFADDKLDLKSFTTDMLGGNATGRLQLDGRRKAVRLDFDGKGLLLERWFKERGSSVPFTGGPMKVTARLASRGNSMRELAAGITGPLDIRMGRGVLNSARAGEAEAKMTSAFSGRKEAQQIDFECVGFALPFRDGRASAERLIGVSTASSNLLTSGYVDMRSQEIDLRGRIKGKSGVGYAAIAGDVKVTGSIRQPHMALDETATPRAIARGAAAVATLGLSVIGTAKADSEDTRRNNPCDAVFKK